jgi:hypothetical protein
MDSHHTLKLECIISLHTQNEKGKKTIKSSKGTLTRDGHGCGGEQQGPNGVMSSRSTFGGGNHLFMVSRTMIDDHNPFMLTLTWREPLLFALNKT